MRRGKSVLISAFAFILLSLAPSNLVAQYSGTLHPPAKRQVEHVCLNFQTGITSSRGGSCDLSYGLLGINNDFDWLQVSMSQESRTVIRNIGQFGWNEQFEVPVVTALPKLQPGEKRIITIEANGADGADGARGARGADASRSDPGSGVIHANEVQLDSRNQRPSFWAPTPPRAKHDGLPKVDPAYVKAVVGHMYVAHVVNEVSGYYALFRVDALEDGACTVSWKLIPTPQK